MYKNIQKYKNYVKTNIYNQRIRLYKITVQKKKKTMKTWQWAKLITAALNISPMLCSQRQSYGYTGTLRYDMIHGTLIQKTDILLLL